MARPPTLRGASGLRRPFISQSCLSYTPRNVRHIHPNTASRKEQEEAQWQEKAADITTGKRQSMLNILESRGLIKEIAGSRDALDFLLTHKRTAAYAGVDPTAPSLHLGHLLPFMVLFHLHINGFHTIALIGGATAKVGDPTGRLASRTDMDTSERLSNLTSITMQMQGLWRNLVPVASSYGYKKDLSWRRDSWNNAGWLGNVTMLDFLSVMGRGMRMGTMMGRDTVKNKMANGDGMSFAEFTYPLLQAWDWWHLYSNHDVQVQIGGSDQYGNIVAGMDAIKFIQGGKQEKEDFNALNSPFGITVPLLTTSSGAKFGKSAGNAVWLDPNLTSPFDLYGFLLRSSDADVQRYLQLFTFIPLDQIAAVMATHFADPGKRTAQHLLARQVLNLVHGTKIAKETEDQHRLLRKPTLSSLTSSATSSSTDTVKPANSKNNAEPMTSASLTPSVEKITLPLSLVAQNSLVQILHRAGLAKSRSEATRTIKSGGVYIGANTTSHSSEPMPDDELKFRPASSVTQEMLDGYVRDTGVLVLRIGKWKVRVVEVVEDAIFEARGLDCVDWDRVLKSRQEVEDLKKGFNGKNNEGKNDEVEEEEEESNVVDLRKPSKDGKWRNNHDMFERVG